MTIWRTAVERPQKLWLRKALFQIHLWMGISVGLYVLLIGITGVSLVFREELEQALDPPRVSGSFQPGPDADLLVVADRLRTAYPDRVLAAVVKPMSDNPAIVAYLRKGTDYLTVEAHPVSGMILGPKGAGSGFLNWLGDLHFNLLAGRTGRIVNGVGALFLLALFATSHGPMNSVTPSTPCPAYPAPTSYLLILPKRASNRHPIFALSSGRQKPNPLAPACSEFHPPKTLAGTSAFTWPANSPQPTKPLTTMISTSTPGETQPFGNEA